MEATVLLCQALLSFSAPSEPTSIRFGIPVSRRDVAHGAMLRLNGAETRSGHGPAFQWTELLPSARGVVIAGRSSADRVWIEVAIDGASGPMSLRRDRGSRGVAASSDRSGAAVRFERSNDAASAQSETGAVDTRTWQWQRSGSVDRVERVQVSVEIETTSDKGGNYTPGEWMTNTAGRPNRAALVTIPAKFWRAAGVLPDHDLGIGRDIREALLDAVSELRGAPGARGRGDYLRGGGAPERPEVITNLEYDTTLGFLRLGLVSGRRELLRRGYESAYHLIDRDLDPRSGLPFCHGTGHRVARPELGHCWLRGLLLAGCLFADRVLIDAALDMGRALAERALDAEARPTGLARDVACPLMELESLLRVIELPNVVAACDRLGADLLRRWDDARGVFVFEEGVLGGGARRYKERCWQTAGILVPALRLWTERSGSARGRECLRRTEARLLALLRRGREGVPLRYLIESNGRRFGELRRSGTAAACFMLEGLSVSGLRRAWSRSQVRRAFSGVPDTAAHDLATEFSLAARCDWIYR